MKRRLSESFEINADAFLDTVANLVGVLVILVVVVASQTKIAAKAVVEKVLAEESNSIVDEQLETAKSVEKDLIRQAESLRKYQQEWLDRKAERDRLLTELIVRQEEVEQQKESLTEEQQQEVANQVELDELQQKIASLLAQQGDIESSEVPTQTITLQHLPTPMAKTVFGDEVHVLLQRNLISVIPWDTLIESLKTHAQMAASRAVRSDRIVDTLGPVEGFTMKFALKAQRGLISNGSSMSMAQSVSLEYFVLDPTADVIREDLESAFQVSGRLRTELSLHTPRNTTVTVWVYPDSFGTFRELKERLFVDGYLTAARPLPEGIRIGASPQGTSSTSQ